MAVIPLSSKRELMFRELTDLLREISPSRMLEILREFFSHDPELMPILKKESLNKQDWMLVETRLRFYRETGLYPVDPASKQNLSLLEKEQFELSFVAQRFQWEYTTWAYTRDDI